MRILALDSSGIVATVAIVEDDNLLAEYTVNYKKTSPRAATAAALCLFTCAGAKENGIFSLAWIVSLNTGTPSPRKVTGSRG